MHHARLPAAPGADAPNPPNPPTRAAQAPAWRLADLRGLAQLGVGATQGITGLAEELHGRILRRVLPLGPADHGAGPGVAGWVYRAVRGTTGLVGQGIDATLGGLSAWLGPPADGVWPEREAAVAALNGLLGDHLAATANPLAITMALRVQGRALALSRTGLAQALPGATGRVLVQLHGLCMNDLQWTRNGHDHGRTLADAHGYTPLKLHYNSGRHVADNGRALAALLDALLANWPVPVTGLVLLGHSMGGLVARSACHAAETGGLAWRRQLRALVCLGTPHHGAALERGGRGLDTLLELSPWVAPFARLGQARSAGITDLRYGNVQAADVPAAGRHAQRSDSRVPTPLPAGVATHAVAATTATAPRGLKHALLGDGLVGVASAFGDHPNPALALALPASHRRLVTQTNHWDLLSRPEVAAALLRWLA